MFQFISPPMPHFIECGEKKYPIGGQHPNRSNIGVFDLIFITRGAHYLVEEDHSYHVPAGTFLILRPDRSHYALEPCREETHCFWLHFQTSCSWSINNEEDLLIPPQSTYPYNKHFSFYLPQTQTLRSPDKIIEIFRQLIFLEADSTTRTRWKQQQLFLDLLLCLQAEEAVPKNNPYLKLAEETATYLRQHYQDPISYKELTECLHFHVNYIALCMKKTFGCTPLEYLTRHRVDQAKWLLIYTNEPVGKIAESTGFRSFTHFIRCFGRNTGMNPTNYRKQYRTKER